jgi:hypothetical protein
MEKIVIENNSQNVISKNYDAHNSSPAPEEIVEDTFTFIDGCTDCDIDGCVYCNVQTNS